MNAIHFLPTTTLRTPAKPVDASRAPIPTRTRLLHRERDFGVGYGNSRGYASAHRYVDNRAQPRFRCI